MKAVRYLAGMVAIVAIPLAIIWVPKGFMNFFFGGQRWSRDYNLFLDRNLASAYPVFWMTVGFWAVVALIWSLYARTVDYDYTSERPDYYGDLKRSKRREWDRENRVEAEWNVDSRTEGAVGAVAACLLIILATFQGWTGWWNNKDMPNYFNESTLFVVDGLDPSSPPDSIRGLFNGFDVGDGETCDFTGDHDVPSCIVEGSFPTEGFENRGASLATANRVMRDTTGETSRVDLLKDTTAYIYPDSDDDVASEGETSNGYWSSIRDGSKYTPTEGVATWDGTSRSAEVCKFDGDHELNRALRGQRRNSLTHLMADEFPELRWRQSDVYGYCDGPATADVEDKEPVVVFPVFRNERFNNRSVEVPAGVIVMRGSSSGDPQFEYMQSVEPGQVPGPVYALSFAEEQREQHIWAAGRRHMNNAKFGFSSTDAASQSGNATEFQLRWRHDGRTYWVTPLTPRNSDSQRVRAYSLIPADEVVEGQLNQMTIYVLAEDDPRSVNVDTLESDIDAFASEENQAFATNGEIQEIIPGEGSTWLAFGARDDRPFFIAEYDPTVPNPRPVITYVRGSGATGQTPDTPSDDPAQAVPPCSKPLAEQSSDELVACVTAAAQELSERQSAQG